MRRERIKTMKMRKCIKQIHGSKTCNQKFIFFLQPFEKTVKKEGTGMGRVWGTGRDKYGKQ